MENTKQMKIKNRTYCFFIDIINIKGFDSNLLKIDKKSYKKVIHTLLYKKLMINKNIYGVNPLYLIISKVDGFIEEKNENKCLAFDSTDENKEVLRKYREIWDGIKNEIKTINGGKAGEHGKDFNLI